MPAAEEPLPGEPEAIKEGEREFAEAKTHQLDDILGRVIPIQPPAPEDEIMDAVVEEIHAGRRSRRRLEPHDGEETEVTAEGGRIVLVSKEEAAERHPEIDAAIGEGLADIAAGRVSPSFSSVAEWKAWLKTPEGEKFGAE